MREIKFRAFTPVDKTMHRPLDIKEIMKVGWVSEDCILMQFTGLLDKNGVEVFEGDLLKLTTEYLNRCGSKTNDQYRSENYAFYEVFFHDNDACDSHIGFQMNRRHTVGADGELQISPGFKPSIVKNCEIIGNIYQNPELLKE